nr:tetratricopeptide repeat protein [Lentzea guizhouensis]
MATDIATALHPHRGGTPARHARHRRAALHLRAARSLRAHGPRPAVAEHLLETAPGLEPWAGEVLDRAAHEAVGRGDSSAAARLLWRVLREPVANPARALRMLGVAELVGNLPGANARLREAFESDVDDVDSAVALSYALHADGKPLELVDVLQASQAFPHLVVHGLVWQEAVPAVVPLDTPAGVLHHVMVGAIGADEAVAGLSTDGAMSALTSAMVLNLADQLDAALAILDDVDRAQAPALRALVSVMRANVQRRKGDLVSARADLVAASDHLRQDPRWHAVTAWHAALLADILLEEGRPDEALALIEKTTTDEVRRMWTYSGMLTVRGRALIVQGEDNEALEAFLAASRHCELWPYRNPAALAWRSGAAVACAALGDGERARRFALEEVELARIWGAPRALGMALRALGRVTAGAAGARTWRRVRVLRGSPPGSSWAGRWSTSAWWHGGRATRPPAGVVARGTGPGAEVRFHGDGRTRPLRAGGHERGSAADAPDRADRAHPGGAPGGDAGGTRAEQRGDRRGVAHAGHRGRGRAHRRLPQARRLRPVAALRSVRCGMTCIFRRPSFARRFGPVRPMVSVAAFGLSSCAWRATCRDARCPWCSPRWTPTATATWTRPTSAPSPPAGCRCAAVTTSCCPA